MTWDPDLSLKEKEARPLTVPAAARTHPEFLSPCGSQWPYQGTIESSSAEGCALSWKIMFVAFTMRVARACSSPVFRLRSKRGKLLLETSSRSLCPARKTLLVAHRSTAMWYVSPGFASSGFSCELR